MTLQSQSRIQFLEKKGLMKANATKMREEKKQASAGSLGNHWVTGDPRGNHLRDLLSQPAGTRGTLGTVNEESSGIPTWYLSSLSTFSPTRFLFLSSVLNTTYMLMTPKFAFWSHNFL